MRLLSWAVLIALSWGIVYLVYELISVIPWVGGV